MKRREALRNIILASIGVTLLPSCDFESFKYYENLPLVKKQYRLIRELQGLILPIKEPQMEVEGTPLDHLLTRLNDCYSMKDIEKYLSGLAEFEVYISEKIKQDFHKLPLEDQMEAISINLDAEDDSNAINFFMKTNKALTTEHFVRSKYFLTTQMDYEFIPGRYIGCAQV